MFSDMNSTDIKGRFSVEFNAFEVEDMNPYILREFNAVSASPVGGINTLLNKYLECELYDTENDHSNGDWPKYPYIYWDRAEKNQTSIDTSNSGPRKYFLRWKYDILKSAPTTRARGNGGR